MPNAEALREIIPVLRELEQADRFHMAEWARGDVNPNAADWTQCGTQFCLAGAKAAYDGWKPQYRIETVYDSSKGEHVDRAVATGSFVRAEDQATVHDRWSSLARDPENIATRAFELTAHQAHFLFYATHISRVDDMVRRMEWLIAGRNPDDFPMDWISEEEEHADEDGYDGSANDDPCTCTDCMDQDSDECEGDCGDDQCPHC